MFLECSLNGNVLHVHSTHCKPSKLEIGRSVARCPEPLNVIYYYILLNFLENFSEIFFIIFFVIFFGKKIQKFYYFFDYVLSAYDCLDLTIYVRLLGSLSVYNSLPLYWILDNWKACFRDPFLEPYTEILTLTLKTPTLD